MLKFMSMIKKKLQDNLELFIMYIVAFKNYVSSIYFC